MQKLQIAICDDERAALSAVKGVGESIVKEYDVLPQLDTFPSASAMLKAAGEKSYDLILLDIRMPETDGITLGAQLKKLNTKAEIIYVSSREDKVFDAMKLRPFGFVRKTHFINDMTAVMLQYMESKRIEKEPNWVFFQYNSSEVRIESEQIEYIESARDYQYVFIHRQMKPIKIRASMRHIEKQLEEQDFVRVHIGYIVNLLYVKRIDNTTLTLTSEKEIPVSRRKLGDLRSKYMAYCRNSGFIHLSRHHN